MTWDLIETVTSGMRFGSEIRGLEMFDPISLD